MPQVFIVCKSFWQAILKEATFQMKAEGQGFQQHANPAMLGAVQTFLSLTGSQNWLLIWENLGKHYPRSWRGADNAAPNHESQAGGAQVLKHENEGEPVPHAMCNEERESDIK